MHASATVVHKETVIIAFRVDRFSCQCVSSGMPFIILLFSSCGHYNSLIIDHQLCRLSLLLPVIPFPSVRMCCYCSSRWHRCCDCWEHCYSRCNCCTPNTKRPCFVQCSRCNICAAPERDTQNPLGVSRDSSGGTMLARNALNAAVLIGC